MDLLHPNLQAKNAPQVGSWFFEVSPVLEPRDDPAPTRNALGCQSYQSLTRNSAFNASIKQKSGSSTSLLREVSLNL
jgi:hypothetical protein